MKDQFAAWIDTPEGREAYKLAQDRDFSAALRAAYSAGYEKAWDEAGDYYAPLRHD